MIEGNGSTINFGGNKGILLVVNANSTLTLNNVTITNINNDGANRDGTAIYVKAGGEVILNNSRITGNAVSGNGGGIYVDGGTVTLNNSTVSGNTAGSNGGGIYVAGGSLTLEDSVVSGNRAKGDNSVGGGIYVKAGSATLTKSSVSENTAAFDGGGFYVVSGMVTLKSSRVMKNIAEDSGGGIFWEASGTLTLDRSSVSGNTATSAVGGGLVLGSTGAANITKSAIIGNMAGISGAGIYSAGDLTIKNSTTSDNRVTASGKLVTAASDNRVTVQGFFGGGVSLSGGTSTLTHVTIANNSAASGGGLYKFSGAVVNLHNSIISGNTVGDCAIEGANGALDENAGNFIGDGSCSSMYSGDPMFGSRMMGSPSFLPLRPGSPAVNAATCISGITEDQRGSSRPYPQGGNCDIGAYEYVPPPPPKEEAPPATSTPLPCPSAPGGGAFGPIGSGAWRNHFARLGIQAADGSRQTEWARGDASVSGANICLWEYECSTDGHWVYGHYHATHGHNYGAPGTRPPSADNRSPGGAFNLCYSVWSGGCNSAEAWQFGHASGKEIYERWLYGRQLQAAPSGCQVK